MFEPMVFWEVEPVKRPFFEKGALCFSVF